MAISYGFAERIANRRAADAFAVDENTIYLNDVESVLPADILQV